MMRQPRRQYPGKRAMSPEEQLHRGVIEYLRLAFPPGSGVVYFHVPMGMARSKAEGGRLKAMGARAGVWDLGFFARDRTVWIELKAESDLSAVQVEFMREVSAIGHRCHVCRSVDAVERALRQEGLRPAATVASAQISVLSGHLL